MYLGKHMIAAARRAGIIGHREQPGDWQLDASCAEIDPELFFPSRGEDAVAAPIDPKVPKRICGSCAVSAECLAYALLTESDDGIWGGVTGRDRENMKLDERIAAVAAAGVDVNVPPPTSTYPEVARRDEVIEELTAKGRSAAEIAQIVEISQRDVVRSRGRIRRHAVKHQVKQMAMAA